MRPDEGSFEVVRSLKLNHAVREAFALSCTALFRAFEVNGIPEPHMDQTSWIPTTHIYSVFVGRCLGLYIILLDR